MKSFKLIISVFSFLLVFSCSTEEESNSVNTANVVLEENNVADSFIENLYDIAATNKSATNFIKYDLAMTSDGFFELENERTIDKTRHSDAFYKTITYKNNMTISGFNNNSQRGLIVCCSSGGEMNCVSCGGSPSEETICVLNQINACIGNGGCSTICPGEKSTLLYDAGKDEFSIFKAFKQ